MMKYTDKVAEFNKKNSITLDIQPRLLDILCELGEFSKEVLKSSEYGNKMPQKNDALIDELGDLLYATLSLCGELQVSPEEVLDQTLEKYQTRISQSGSISSENG